jgi:hypothetical protein
MVVDVVTVLGVLLFGVGGAETVRHSFLRQLRQPTGTRRNG